MNHLLDLTKETKSAPQQSAGSFLALPKPEEESIDDLLAGP